MFVTLTLSLEQSLKHDKASGQKSASLFKYRNSRKMNPNSSKWILTLGVESFKSVLKTLKQGLQIKTCSNWAKLFRLLEKF
jgi:hypothetical protein